MNNYYLMSGKHIPNVASAFAPEGTKLSYELFPELSNVKELPFELNLVKLTVGKNGLIESNDLSDLKDIWLDYQPSSHIWPLMSEKLQSIVKSNLTGNEGIEWIRAIIKGPNEIRKYFIPSFSKQLDVLDLQKTMFVSGSDRIIRPVFSKEKINNYSVFPLPSNNYWRIPSAIYVNEDLKKIIQKEKLTGLVFEKTLVV